MRFDGQFIKQIIPEVSIHGGPVPSDPLIFTDSRLVEPGSIFVALKGAHADGHDFVLQVIEKGAAALMIALDRENEVLKQIPEKEKYKICIIAVPDPATALIRLATAWRSQFAYPVIGITGSIGKTSTKELLSHVLDLNQTPHVASHGNQNTKIGAAINMLRMREHHKVAIFEMGINKRGEMANLSYMIKPTTAVITMIAHSHMEGLGSLQDIAIEKRNIFKYFLPDQVGVINGDIPLLSNVSYPHPVIKFGTKTTNQIQARKVRISGTHISFVLKIYQEKYPIIIKHSHVGVINNALAVAAVAHLLNIPHDIIVQAIQQPCVVTGRFERRQLRNTPGIMIHDCYNANPESMKAALHAFEHMDTKAQKIAVLGDMLELGINSSFWHRQLGRFLRKVPSLKKVILVGSLVESTLKTAPVGLQIVIVSTWKDAVKELQDSLTQESVVLVKGSRGTGLWQLVEQLS